MKEEKESMKPNCKLNEIESEIEIESFLLIQEAFFFFFEIGRLTVMTGQWAVFQCLCHIILCSIYCYITFAVLLCMSCIMNYINLKYCEIIVT